MTDRAAQGFVAKRVEVSQPAVVYFGSTAAPVQLLDLSLTGAMALADAPPVKGTMISIACASEHVPARVVWTRGNRFGLAFANPLAPFQAEAMAGIAGVQPPQQTVKVKCSTASLGAGVIKRDALSADC